ncbi:hypothetical protein FRX31_032984 [Thalictrum thalictroides]|uniref:Uncharacterized protein n=1 Tax=Thalictrum thalictroides TaxID=46969 RepID=A0A7J6UYE0_THATH|nr:hypothetical protein FRX31_032984 [Thalictrum thalictroides]
MGNCLRHKSSSSWKEDDISTSSFSVTSKDGLLDKAERNSVVEEDQSLIDDQTKVPASSTAVKIKITKKQLEELLGRADVQSLSIEQVLTQLINISDIESQAQPWKPVLQSIPEMDSIYY